MSDALLPRLAEEYQKTWRESADKFDAMLTTVIAALAGYIGQNLPAARLGFNAPTLEVVALAVLLFSLYASFRRYEAVIYARRYATDRIFLKEEAEAVHVAVIAAKSKPGGMVTNAATGERVAPDVLAERAESLRQEAAAISPRIDAANLSANRLYGARTTTLLAGIALVAAARVWGAYTPQPAPAVAAPVAAPRASAPAGVPGGATSTPAAPVLAPAAVSGARPPAVGPTRTPVAAPRP